MLLTTPYVLGIDDSPGKNLLRQVAARSETLERTLSNFTGDRVRGWLFHPADGNDDILIVRPKTKLTSIASTYTRVLRAEVEGLAEPRIDLGTGAWLRHPLLGAGSPYQIVLDSWRGAFSYVEEDQEHDIIGLRAPQIGAVHAVHSHWTVSDAPATIVMPTGTGKTETMLSVLVSAFSVGSGSCTSSSIGPSRTCYSSMARPTLANSRVWRKQSRAMKSS
jgi:hypothetical protein